jgi:DNA-binding CsgD family transcriptional regulator
VVAQGPGPVPSGVPLGRAAELGAVERFLAPARAGRVLVVCGEPGIGKSTVWEAGVGVARSRGLAVWSARASEAGTQLSYAGLADLVEGAGPGVLAGLPPPQRRALEVAVRRAEPAGAPPDPLAVAAGLLGALRVAAGAGPVLVAVDDLPWLDQASAGAVVFAARRLADQDVRFLAARRSGRDTELEKVAEPAGVARLDLGPLSFGAVSGLLAARLGRPLPRRVARLVFDTCGGNPLFALELGRAVVEHGVPEIGAGLPVPEVLGELFGARVAGLPARVRRALLAVALSHGLTGDELAAVTDPLAVEDGQAAGVLVVEGGRVRAAHPLLAAAAVGRSTAAGRRDLHAALGAVAGDRVLAARHRALAATGPDAALAGQVSAAAAQAAARGAIADAAELAGQALRLTSAGASEYDGRLLALARYLIDAGEHARATALLTKRAGALPAGPVRAVAYLLLAENADSVAGGEEHLARAITDSAAAPGLRAQALARQALLQAADRARRIAETEQMAGQALAAAASAGPDAERQALQALAFARVLRGRGIEDLLERSAALPPGTASLFDSSVEMVAGLRLAYRRELAAAREVFRGLLAAAEQRGDARSGAVFTLQLCKVELRAGDTVAAARELAELDQWAALDWITGTRGSVQAALAAVRGDPGQAAALAAEAVAVSEANGVEWDRLEALRVAGVAALLARDPQQAVTSLAAVWEHTQREGVDDPGVFPVAGDLAEALAEAGRPKEATEVTGRLAGLAAAQDHPWGLATAQRSAAVVTLAGGYDQAAAAQLAGAADAYRALGLGWDAARALLVLGRAQRRATKRAAARDSLEQARAGFEQLGCPGWAGAAAAQLDRISGRRAAAAGGLTPSEQRVAELAAAGLSNQQAAAQLYLSVTTVKAHLRAVYAKLGVTSRGQLTRRLGAGG